MTPDAFAAFRAVSLAHHAAELMAEEHDSREDALREAEAELCAMLPQGADTKGNCLCTVCADGADSGYLWFVTEESDGVMQAFLCDFFIAPGARRKGYGKAALEQYHAMAAGLRCGECVLFVADGNPAVRALYEKCGYTLLERHNYGCFMKKRCSPAEPRRDHGKYVGNMLTSTRGCGTVSDRRTHQRYRGAHGKKF